MAEQIAAEMMDTPERHSWVAEQIEETIEDIKAGSYAPGSFVIGGEDYAVEVVIDGAGRITRWARV